MGFTAPDRYVSDDLLLRSYEPGDGRALWDAVRSSRDHLRPFMPWALVETAAEQEEERVRGWRARWLLGEEFVIGVWRAGVFAGSTGFDPGGRPIAQGYAEIGMWIRADQAGRGLGQRVLRALVDWADEAWPWQRLEWRCDARNRASARVAERCGFRLEGRIRQPNVDHLDPAQRLDELVFGLLPADPRPWR